MPARVADHDASHATVRPRYEIDLTKRLGDLSQKAWHKMGRAAEAGDVEMGGVCFDAERYAITRRPLTGR